MLLKIFEIEREISLSTLDFSLESETLINALNFACENDFYFSGVYPVIYKLAHVKISAA